MDAKYLAEIKARYELGRPAQQREVNALLAEVERQDQQIATLKRALELAEDMLTKMTPFKSKGGWHDRLIQQAQEQEGKK